MMQTDIEQATCLHVVGERVARGPGVLTRAVQGRLLDSLHWLELGESEGEGDHTVVQESWPAVQPGPAQHPGHPPHLLPLAVHQDNPTEVRPSVLENTNQSTVKFDHINEDEIFEYRYCPILSTLYSSMSRVWESRLVRRKLYPSLISPTCWDCFRTSGKTSLSQSRRINLDLLLYVSRNTSRYPLEFARSCLTTSRNFSVMIAVLWKILLSLIKELLSW